MNDYVVQNYGPKDIVITDEVVIKSMAAKVVPWKTLWLILDKCNKEASIVVYEVGECLLDWS